MAKDPSQMNLHLNQFAHHYCSGRNFVLVILFKPVKSSIFQTHFNIYLNEDSGAHDHNNNVIGHYDNEIHDDDIAPAIIF